MCIVQANMNGCRISIIGRLRTVHMVIRRAVLILSALMSHQFQRTIGNHFISIHVGGSSGSALNHVHRKLVVILSFQYFFTGFEDSIRLFFRQQIQFTVGNSSPHFCDSQCLNKQRVLIQMKLADAKVFNTTECLYSVQCTFGHFTTTYQVALCSSFF